MADNGDPLVYEDEEATEQVATEGSGDAPAMEEVKGISIHSSGCINCSSNAKCYNPGHISVPCQHVVLSLSLEI